MFQKRRMNVIKLYTDELLFISQKRSGLIDILKPFLGKDTSYSDDQRIKEYGISEKVIIIVKSIQECDLVVLPMSWSYYHLKNQLEIAINFVNNGIKNKKPVLSWINGDFGVDIPIIHDKLFVLRSNGYKSKLPVTHLGLPSFFPDPVKFWCDSGKILYRDWSPTPNVGFCGYANNSFTENAKIAIQTIIKKIKYRIKVSPFHSNPISPSFLSIRARSLSLIEKEKGIQNNFIKRAAYRAGALTEIERTETTKEYFRNMAESDYIVCVRGGGNFSVRLYETLAMGRIPVFINTDCLLPLSDSIIWRDHMVWVEHSELKQIGQKIKEFHNQLTPDDFNNLQKRNRKLWEEKLTIGGYFNNLLLRLE